MKKIVTLILSALMLFSVVGCGSGIKSLTSPVTNESIGSITVYGYDSKSEPNYGLLYLGHAFLSVTNLSDNNVKVGAIELKPKETCSVGAWGMNTHFGIWYNVESAYINEDARYVGRVSLTKGLKDNDFELLSDYIAANDKWTPLSNCSQFAMAMFNCVSGDKLNLSGIITPSSLISELKSYKEWTTDNPINNYGKIGHLKNGEFCEYNFRQIKE